jgi:hypothetical protein
LDKSFIASAVMYPGRGAAPPAPVALEVGGKAREASIGHAGEEDLFGFNASAAGRYLIETTGPTDIVMRLFGPGSQTALIAEDDDGGYGLNARIAANLIPGQYFVQVRHYNLEAGTGKYSVKVRKG